MPDETDDTKTYVLVILKHPITRHAVVFGPFRTYNDATYAAMDYYGTAITGASSKNEFLIAELRSGSSVTPEGAWK
jgi:hypothetical protein